MFNFAIKNETSKTNDIFFRIEQELLREANSFLNLYSKDQLDTKKQNGMLYMTILMKDLKNLVL